MDEDLTGSVDDPSFDDYLNNHEELLDDDQYDDNEEYEDLEEYYEEIYDEEEDDKFESDRRHRNRKLTIEDDEEVMDDYELEELLEEEEDEYDEEYDDEAEVQDDFGNEDGEYLDEMSEQLQEYDDEYENEEMQEELDEELQEYDNEYDDEEELEEELEEYYEEEQESYNDINSIQQAGAGTIEEYDDEDPGELEYGVDDEYDVQTPGEIEYGVDDEMDEAGNINMPDQEEEYDDYNEENYDGSLEYNDDEYEEGAADEFSPRPIYARSELILGGVNPNRYEGCLFWHPAINDDKSTTAWSIELDLQIGNNEEKTIAAISSATELVHGPTDVVGQFLTANKAMCYELDNNDEIGPKLDTCEDGYDVAFFDCSNEQAVESFTPLQFVAQGQSYSLGFDDLVTSYADDSGNEICEFRLVSGDVHKNHWVFGTPFFTKYYIALDVQKGSVGIAKQGWGDNDQFCKEDEGIFVSNGNAPEVTSVAQSAATSTTISSKNSATTSIKAVTNTSPERT